LDQKNVVGFWRDLLNEVSKSKPIQGDINFTGSVIASLLAFLALRGWTLQDFSKKKQIDLLVDFILRGLGVI